MVPQMHATLLRKQTYHRLRPSRLQVGQPLAQRPWFSKKAIALRADQKLASLNNCMLVAGSMGFRPMTFEIRCARMNTFEQLFLVVRGLYTTCMPTRRPTQTYAACEGCLREHKSASRCLRECLRVQMLSSSVEVHCGSSSWKIATFQFWQLRR